MVRSFDSDTDFFDIIAGVLYGNTLAPYLFIICLDYTKKATKDLILENSLAFKKKRENAQMISLRNTDIHKSHKWPRILVTTPAEVEFFPKLNSFYVNSNKFFYFKEEAMFTLNGNTLKLVDQIPSLGSIISSTVKARNGFDWLLIIW